MTFLRTLSGSSHNFELLPNAISATIKQCVNQPRLTTWCRNNEKAFFDHIDPGLLRVVVVVLLVFLCKVTEKV